MLNKKAYLKLEKKKHPKRPVGVTILGIWLFIQGLFVLGNTSQIGIWAWVATALLMLLGIGILRLQKEAYIATLVSFILMAGYSLYILLFYGISEITGIAFSGIIISGIIIYYLSKRNVRKLFASNKNEG